MQKSACLYHQLTGQKNKQKSFLNTSKQSNKKRSIKNQQISTLKISKHGNKKQIQQFNDYTIYPPQKQNPKRIKLCSNETFTNREKTKISFINQQRKKLRGDFRDYSTSDFKSVRSNKSRRQKVCFTEPNQIKPVDESFQQKIEHLLKIFCDEKIKNLENKITELSQKLQQCETDTTKNHFQFILLRDIVQKLKMQNLQLSSKIIASQNFLKIKNQIIINKAQQVDSLCSENVQTQLEFVQKKQNDQLSKQKLILNQQLKIQKQSNFNEESTTSQKFQNYIEPYKGFDQSFQNIQKKISQIVGKQVNSLSNKCSNEKISSNLKKNKPKKILHFQNALRQEKLLQQKKIIEEQKIQKLFKKVSQRQIKQNLSSVISSEQNLLQSLESKNNLNQPKPKQTLQNQCSIDNTQKQIIENSFFNLLEKDDKISLKQIQSQIQQFQQLLQILKKKQRTFSNDRKKLDQLRSQKERVYQLLEKLKQDYNNKQYQ